jgi:glycosyltransferase involved in cell wall biosynthesis
MVLRMPSDKRNILIIAHMHDFPTKGRPVAGTFIKEFVDCISDSCNYRLMLVKKDFIRISVRAQTSQLISLAKRLLNGAIFEKRKIEESDYAEQAAERILPVSYPVLMVFGRPLYLLSGLTLAMTANKVLKKSGFKPDIIQTFKSFPSAYIGWKLKRRFRVPVVNVEYQGPFARYSDEPYCMKRALTAIRNIDRTVYTKFQTKVIKSYGIPEGKLGHWYFGVDAKKFAFDEEKYLKRKTETAKNRFKLLIVGRVEEEKGLKYLIMAMPELVDKYPEIRLSIAGPKGNCFDWVTETIGLLGLKKNVQYLGEVQREELPGVINDHDIVVVASLFETLGLTTFEAMSCGKPVVAARCGGPEEIINEETGVLVPVGNSQALAKGAEHVIQNYEKYDPMRIRQYVLKNYDYRVMKERLFRLYGELILRG